MVKPEPEAVDAGLYFSEVPVAARLNAGAVARAAPAAAAAINSRRRNHADSLVISDDAIGGKSNFAKVTVPF